MRLSSGVCEVNTTLNPSRQPAGHARHAPASAVESSRLAKVRVLSPEQERLFTTLNTANI
jgi:hypothetical protein